MVAGIRFVDTCWCHTHIDEAEANCRLLWKRRPVLQADKVDPGVGGCRLARGRVTDTNPDESRHDGGRVRDVVLVAHEQLQGVRAWLERNLGLGLPGAEVKVVEVVGNRLVERR